VSHTLTLFPSYECVAIRGGGDMAPLPPLKYALEREWIVCHHTTCCFVSAAKTKFKPPHLLDHIITKKSSTQCHESCDFRSEYSTLETIWQPSFILTHWGSLQRSPDHAAGFKG